MPWLALAYPVLVHLSVWLKEPRLQWLSLTVLAALVLFDALKRKSAWAWLTLVALSGALFALTMAGGAQYALYLTPIALPAALCILFARSLRTGSRPLITRFAAAVRSSMPSDLATYTDRLTVIWVLVLAAMTLSALLAALLASQWWWSLLTNFVHYGVLGAVFLVEYIFRRIRFRHLEHPGFIAYIRLLFATRLRQV